MKIDLITGSCNNPTGRTIAGFYNSFTKINITSNYTSMAWMTDNDIRGIALFDNYTGNNIDIHIWVRKGVSRRMIRDVYDYAFGQLKCLRLSGKIPSDNKKLLQLLPRFDFEYECKLKNYLGDAAAPLDMYVYNITCERAMKWINRNGCTKSASCA